MPDDDRRERWWEGVLEYIDAGDLIEIVVHLAGEIIGFIFSALLELLSGL